MNVQCSSVHILKMIADLGAGGSLSSRIRDNLPDATTARIILTEMIVAIESFHKAGILHRDIFAKNTVIDSTGHLKLTDLGRSEWRTDNDPKHIDWKSLFVMCRELFSQQFRLEDQPMLFKLLLNMSDSQLPGIEIKLHICAKL